jgi:hypothetical protein
MTAAREIPGRVVVTARAQERVLAALAADELGIPLRSAKARVSDDAGRLAAEIAAPARVTPEGVPLLSLIEEARSRVTTDGADLTGAEISRVTVRITGVDNDSRRVS